MYTYPYPRPMVTVDIIVLRRGSRGTEILLIQRANEPFRGCWAFPGGFVDENEDLEAAAYRELREETGLTGLTLMQCRAVGTPGRDPRGHTISVVYVAKCLAGQRDAVAGDDAAALGWFPLHTLPDLAFDHADILNQIDKRTLEEDPDESE